MTKVSTHPPTVSSQILMNPIYIDFLSPIPITNTICPFPSRLHLPSRHLPTVQRPQFSFHCRSLSCFTTVSLFWSSFSFLFLSFVIRSPFFLVRFRSHLATSLSSGFLFFVLTSTLVTLLASNIHFSCTSFLTHVDLLLLYPPAPLLPSTVSLLKPAYGSTSITLSLLYLLLP